MNLFQTCYDLIVQYIFAGQGVDEAGRLVDQMQHLVATEFSTIAWIFLMALPFVVVWWVIKVITTAFGRF